MSYISFGNSGTPNMIPVHPFNYPGGGIPGPAPPVTPSTPVYSNYTGELIGYGPIAKGTPNDAPSGNPQYNGPFHVIQYDVKSCNFIAHGHRR